MWKFIVGLFLIFTLFSFSIANPINITFGWGQDLPSPNDLRGWKLYKSSSAGGPYSFMTEIPFATVQTEYTVTVTIDYPNNQKTKYFYVLTAIDTSGNESGYSNEVAKEVDFLSPVAPKNFKEKL